jgi:hypothetical protein
MKTAPTERSPPEDVVDTGERIVLEGGALSPPEKRPLRLRAKGAGTFLSEDPLAALDAVDACLAGRLW